MAIVKVKVKMNAGANAATSRSGRARAEKCQEGVSKEMQMAQYYQVT